MHKRGILKVFRQSERFSNVMESWRDLGSPKILDDHQAQNLIFSSHVNTTINIMKKPQAAFKIDKGILLAQLCVIGRNSPGQPYGLQFNLITNAQLMISWKYDQGSNCLHNFILEFSKSGRMNDYKVINNMDDSINNFFDYFLSEGSFVGWYRVQPIDVWKRSGPRSPPSYYFDSQGRSFEFNDQKL